MPTLLSVNNYYYRRGGAEAVFFDHNALFKSAGWNVVPLAMRHPKNEPSKWSDYFVDEIELGEKYGLIEAASKAAKSIYSFEAKARMRELIQRAAPDIVHAHNIYHHLSPSVLAAVKAAGLPMAITLHDLKIACPAYKMMTHDGVCERCKFGRLHNVVRHRCVHNSLSLSGLVFLESVVHSLLGSYRRHVDAFFVPSQFYIEKFKEWGWDPERFHYLPNFIDAEIFRPEFSPGQYFVYFGRLSGEKGVGTLIKAAAKAGVALRIAGTGPDEQSLRRLAEEAGGNVEFMGYRSGEDLHALVRESRAVVLPSEWYENAPISVLEAYALGKPVIGAEIGGIPEMIVDGVTGTTFTAYSVDALTEALLSMQTRSDDQMAAMGQEGRNIVKARFSTEAYLDRCNQIYTKLLARG